MYLNLHCKNEVKKGPQVSKFDMLFALFVHQYFFLVVKSVNEGNDALPPHSKQDCLGFIRPWQKNQIDFTSSLFLF